MVLLKVFHWQDTGYSFDVSDNTDSLCCFAVVSIVESLHILGVVLPCTES